MIEILYGNEPYFIAQRKEEIFSEVSDKDFNLSCHETFDESVYDLCRTYPVMDTRRVVYLDIDKLSMLNNGLGVKT